MKILLSGYHNPHYPTITEYMEQAIISLGHELVAFDDRRHIIPGRIRRRCRWINMLDIRHINKNLTDLVDASKPELTVITGGHRIFPESVEIMKSLGVKTALWTIDPPRTFQPLIKAAPHYDFVFCQGTEAIELFRHSGILNARWLPMACAPHYHKPVELSESDRIKFGNDIVFVGSYYPERAELFENLSCFDFALWGTGWENLTKNSPLRKRIRGYHTRPEEWLKIYSASKIVLSTHYHDALGRFPVYQASPRVFEILACGAFQMCDNQRDVFSLFHDGRHLIKFLNGKDLVVKIQYYLENHQERQAITRQGREEVLKLHTYQDRIQELLAIVASS